MAIEIDPPLYTRTCPPLFFEPTPPGTTPGPRPPGRVPSSVSSGGVISNQTQTPKPAPIDTDRHYRSVVKSSQELLSGIHEQGAAKKHGACPRSGRCVLVRAMSQQLNGCVGWVYVRGRCAFSDFSLSLSKFIAIGACLALCLPRACSARGSTITRPFNII